MLMSFFISLASLPASFRFADGGTNRELKTRIVIGNGGMGNVDKAMRCPSLDLNRSRHTIGAKHRDKPLVLPSCSTRFPYCL